MVASAAWSAEARDAGHRRGRAITGKFEDWPYTMLPLSDLLHTMVFCAHEVWFRRSRLGNLGSRRVIPFATPYVLLT